MSDKSIIIIGAGFAGLSAGIYAQMNGYRTRIFEMHTLPGGLCTAWKRQGYTIDACVHWLVGSAPGGSFRRYWEEVGIAQGREFVNLDEFARYEGADGRTLILHSDGSRRMARRRSSPSRRSCGLPATAASGSGPTAIFTWRWTAVRTPAS